MSFASAEKLFKQLIFSGNIQQAEKMILENKSMLKLFGAAAWSWALMSKKKDETLSLLIKHKAPVFLPKANTKRFTANSDYTLLLAIKHDAPMLTTYLLDNYKIPAKLLSDAIISLCNRPTFPEQKEVLESLILSGGNVEHKNQKAMFNATFNENSTIIPQLVENGSYLINQTSAVLFLKETKLDPFEYLSVCEDTRSHNALMEVIAAEKLNDLPIDHYGERQ